MTEEQEPRGSEAYQDPLHISPESKADGTSYQWFSTAIFGEKDRTRRPTDGWEAVQRLTMLSEWSDSDEFIQRNEIRLYQRPQELTDKANEDEIGASTSQIRYIEELNGKAARKGGALGYVGGGRNGHAEYVSPERTEWNRIGVGIRSHRRGRIFVIHEEKCYPHLVRFVARHWRGLSRLRVVFISKDETDVMILGGVTSAEWAWCKRDLLREGAFYKGYIYIPSPRLRQPSKLKPRVKAAYRWCVQQAGKIRNLWPKK